MFCSLLPDLQNESVRHAPGDFFFLLALCNNNNTARNVTLTLMLARYLTRFALRRGAKACPTRNCANMSLNITETKTHDLAGLSALRFGDCMTGS